MPEEKYVQCVDDSFDRFEQYDQFVDVVSAWEDFIEGQYSNHFDNLYFDRFPENTLSFNGDLLGPSFTVFFDGDYGILFCVFRDLPRDENNLRDLLSKTKELDENTSFRVGNNNQETPDNYDIVFLISRNNSQTAKHQVQNILSDRLVQFESNFVLMSYEYTDKSTNPKYKFARLSKVDQNFDDDVLPADKQLSRKLSIADGGFETIDSRPGFFDKNKTIGVLCNHNLSELYFACYLWHYVLYDFLTKEQEIVWHDKDPRKTLKIETAVDTIYKEVNSKYVPGRGVQKDWIARTLEFMTVAGVADKINEEEYRIGFRNLQDHNRKHKDVTTRRSSLADLAHLFASWHCEGLLDMNRGERSQLRVDTEAVELEDGLTQPEFGDW